METDRPSRLPAGEAAAVSVLIGKRASRIEFAAFDAEVNETHVQLGSRPEHAGIYTRMQRFPEAGHYSVEGFVSFPGFFSTIADALKLQL